MATPFLSDKILRSQIVQLDLLNGDGAGWTDLHAGLTAYTVFLPGDYRPLVLFVPVIYFRWTVTHALLIALARIIIDSNLEHDFLLLL